ncbi:MAG: hypothetical protein ACYCWE_15945 [Eubacteriales bacterium]
MNNSDMNHITQSAFHTDIIQTFRGLWNHFIIWHNMYIVNITRDYGNIPVITQHIIKITEDFSDALWKFYGYENAEKFKTLLKDHFMISTELLYDVKTGNNEEVNKNITKWYKNADEIADFLASVNPYWSKDEWQNMLHNHIRMLEEKAICKNPTQYDADTVNINETESQSYMMGDYMAAGIIHQFNL